MSGFWERRNTGKRYIRRGFLEQDARHLAANSYVIELLLCERKLASMSRRLFRNVSYAIAMHGYWSMHAKF